MGNITISGKITDQNNNPIPIGSIVFLNNSGQPVSAATTDSSGHYQVTIPAGTYTITADGPSKAKIDEVSVKNQLLTSNAERNFTLKINTTGIAKKPETFSFAIGMIIVLVFIFAALGVWFMRKKTPNPLSQPGSSNQ